MILIITHVELYNIQNYKEPTKFKLSEKVTIFSGRNNTGKTAVRRGIYLFAAPHDDMALRGVLRFGTDTGYCALYLDTGYKLVATLTRIKRKGKEDHIQLHYSYIRLSDNIELNHWNDYDDDILRILKWVRLRTKDGDMILNFKDSGQHLFVNTSGAVNTMALNSLCFNEIYDRKITNIANAVKKEEEIIVRIGQDARLIADRLNACVYTDVTYMEQVREYYKALRLNIKTGAEQLAIYNCLLEIENLTRIINNLKNINFLLKGYMLKVQLVSVLEQDRQKVKLEQLQRLIQLKYLSKCISQMITLQKATQFLQKETIHTKSIKEAVDIKKQLELRYFTQQKQEELSLCLGNIQIQQLCKNLSKITELEKSQSRVHSMLLVCAKIKPKIALNSYQKRRVLQQKLELIQVISRDSMQKVRWQQNLKMQENHNNHRVINKKLQKAGENKQLLLMLQYYLDKKEQQQQLYRVLEKIPTCPTCGKAYLEGKVGG